MYRFLAFVGAAALTFPRLASPPRNPRARERRWFLRRCKRQRRPDCLWRGDDINYGDVDTGGAQGEVLGDPNAVYSPSAPDHPAPRHVPVMPGTGDGLIGGVPIQPAPAPPDNTTATTTNLANSSGTTTENVPVEAAAPEDAAPVATDSQRAERVLRPVRHLVRRAGCLRRSWGNGGGPSAGARSRS